MMGKECVFTDLEISKGCKCAISVTMLTYNMNTFFSGTKTDIKVKFSSQKSISFFPYLECSKYDFSFGT